VILINLLPHRQEKRQRRKVAFFVAMGASAVAGILAVGVWYLALQHLISNQQERNQFLQAEISKLEAQIKNIASLRAEIEALKARQKAVEDLQTDRNVPVHLLNELAKQTPEGVYLTAIRQTDKIISVNGVAQTNERVSELLRNTAYNSEWLERPELIEIKLTPLPSGRQALGQEQRRVFDFSMRVYIKQPATQTKGPKTPERAQPVNTAASSSAKS
jgi:type IV pilus assembly protein PilN